MLSAEMKQAFENAITSIKDDVVGMIVLALPAGLAICGINLAIRLGINFFKSIAS